MTVLVAEEDPQTLALLRSVLETDGFRVLTTTNARDAVNVAFEQTPSLILLDAEIRGGFDIVRADADTEPGHLRLTDGIGFLRIMNEDERLARVPIVVMTADSVETAAFAGTRVKEFLRKPLAPADVMSAVRRVQES
jgi:CheY-like chemotaxis protein